MDKDEMTPYEDRMVVETTGVNRNLAIANQYLDKILKALEDIAAKVVACGAPKP